MIHRSFVLAAFCVAAAVPLTAQTATKASAQWTLRAEPNHSTIGFAVPVAGGLTRVHGSFSDYDVDIFYDEADVTRSSVRVTIRAASVDTRNDMRDGDLRGEKFFDVERHPLITFRSTRIAKNNDAYVATGDLTINGITRSVELITGIDRPEDRLIMGISSNWKVNRKDFDLGTDWRHSIIPNFLGDQVDIEIHLWTRMGTPAQDARGNK